MTGVEKTPLPVRNFHGLAFGSSFARIGEEPVLRRSRRIAGQGDVFSTGVS